MWGSRGVATAKMAEPPLQNRRCGLAAAACMSPTPCSRCCYQSGRPCQHSSPDKLVVPHAGAVLGARRLRAEHCGGGSGAGVGLGAGDVLGTVWQAVEHAPLKTCSGCHGRQAQGASGARKWLPYQQHPQRRQPCRDAPAMFAVVTQLSVARSSTSRQHSNISAGVVQPRPSTSCRREWGRGAQWAWHARVQVAHEAPPGPLTLPSLAPDTPILSVSSLCSHLQLLPELAVGALGGVAAAWAKERYRGRKR